MRRGSRGAAGKRSWIGIGIASIAVVALVGVLVLNKGIGDPRLAGPLFIVYIVSAIAYNLVRPFVGGFDGGGGFGDDDCDGDGGDGGD